MKYLSKREIEPPFRCGAHKTRNVKVSLHTQNRTGKNLPRIGRHFRKEDILRFSFIYVMCLTVKCLHARIIHTIVENDNETQEKWGRKEGKNETNEWHEPSQMKNYTVN